MHFTVLRAPWPIVLKPGLLVLFGLLSLGGGMLIASGRAQSTGTLTLTWQEAVLSGALALAALIIHETGHAVVAHATGRTVERLEFGLAGGAVTSGDTTPWRRVAAIAAGPLAEITAGVLMSVAGGSWGSPLGAAGFIAILNGAGNLLPFHKALDGYRLMRFLRLVFQDGRPLACVPSGPCPACTGVALKPGQTMEGALIGA
ncbi:hypothetical protein GCM10023063_17910 [Arthrobacter methylotrophus]|uniref:M50 family metallopeptidase n=2 Tax=Arthrobacter methylotrophus TaxID=121291 RepID=A0ABV5UNV1_9MICC